MQVYVQFFHVSGLYKYKRTAATHIFVLMISTQSRSKKPYALPVQCIPYVSMTHEHVRQILNNLISLMNERKMKISGNQKVKFGL